MSRVIKFRVWDIKHRVYTPRDRQIGYCDFDIKTGGQITREILGDAPCAIPMTDGSMLTSLPCSMFDRNTTEDQSNYVVEQFTGLKDPYTGKQVYEGDIIEPHEEDLPPPDTYYDRPHYRPTGKRHKVVFVDGCFGIWVSGQGFRPLRHCPFSILGNIHENPDLLS